MSARKDWKTSLAGGLKVLSAVLGVIGVSFNPEQQNAIMAAAVLAYSLFSGAQAYFTADKPADKPVKPMDEPLDL